MNDGLAGAMECPSSQPKNAPTVVGQAVTNYAVNGMFINRRISTVRGSSEYAVLQENKYSKRDVFIRPRRFTFAPVPAGATAATQLFVRFQGSDRYDQWASVETGITGTERTLGNVHNNSGDFLMADGHAENQKTSQTTARLLGLLGKPILTMGAIGGSSNDGYDTGIGKNYGSIIDNVE